MKILVLGSGVVGVASAWYLAQAGHSVTVLERRDAAGLETSFANGGQISAGHAEPWARPEVLPKLVRWLGREDAPLLFRPRADRMQWEWGLRFLFECLPGRFERHVRVLAGIAAYSRDCLRALRQATGLRYDESERGILRFATLQEDWNAIRRHAAVVKSASECLALEPALQYSTHKVLGGAYIPLDESGDAFKFTQGLAARAAEQGVRFVFGCDISAVSHADGKIRAVATTRGEHEADAYLVCLGSYSPLLLRTLGISIPVYPLKGYSITLPLGPAEAEAAPKVSLTDEAGKIVISRLGDRLRAAGTAELAGYDTSVNATRCAAIARRIRELFPQLGAITTMERWAGLRPATPNNVPIIGRTRYPNLFVNTGHGTLGWTLACGSGRLIGDVITGRRPEVEFPLHA